MRSFVRIHRVLFSGGLNIDGEEANWDFGTGAGYYVDATTEKWKNYRMYSYVTKEVCSKLYCNKYYDVVESTQLALKKYIEFR